MTIPQLTNVAVNFTNETIDQVYRSIAKLSKSSNFPGCAVILYKNTNVLAGFVTDGDIRRSYANNLDFNLLITEIMTKEPVCITLDFYEKDYPDFNNLQKLIDVKNKNIKYILLVNDKNEFVSIIDAPNKKIIPKIVTIVGLGFVGITLAAHAASRGYKVFGVDSNENIIKKLKSGDTSHVNEQGLNSLIKSCYINKTLFFEGRCNAYNSSYYIISVGTPINKYCKPDMSAIVKVAEEIAELIKPGDLIMLRSTVALGTTRKLIIPILEKKSQLKCGIDFHVAFTPERTAEGVAMQELSNLPQIIGGFSDSCTSKAVEFWTALSPICVKVESLEVAELVKLANNTFRDLSFAFANELVELADLVNVSAASIIKSANEAYPRNLISLPSPGVGGYCLTKDPLLYDFSLYPNNEKKSLGALSREVNNNTIGYPFKIFKRYCAINKLNQFNLVVGVLGLSFKGDPETNDLRGSTSIDFINLIRPNVADIYCYDFMLDDFKHLNLKKAESISDLAKKVDALFILNNHKLHPTISSYMKDSKIKFIFDGWSQLNRFEIEKNYNIVYSTLGYITKSSDYNNS
jgi:UDP-N-acetyl-D-mannosaminuronic acid dehydrogenase